jgi:hypothetical protein
MKDEEVTVDLTPDPHHAPSYQRGWQDGYEAAEAAANRAWRDSSSWRPGLVEADRYVTIDGKRERVLDWRDRMAQDVVVLREAHAAGLHDAGPARSRCPECADRPDDLYGVRRNGEWTFAHSPSDLHHKGHYGVPDSDPSAGWCGTAVAHDRHPWHDGLCPGFRANTISPNYGVPPDVVEIDRNARAYGWEIGHRGIAPTEVTETSEGNPFMDPDWRTAVDTIKPHYGVPEPMLLVDGRCAGCGHDPADHADLGCVHRAEPGPCACERTDAMLTIDPCAGGRCSDPAAHAEGAHDV